MTNACEIASCASLTSLPLNLGLVGTLTLTGCAALKQMPKGLRLNALSAIGCLQLTALPDDLRVTQKLDLTDCVNLGRCQRAGRSHAQPDELYSRCARCPTTCA